LANRLIGRFGARVHGLVEQLAVLPCSTEHRQLGDVYCDRCNLCSAFSSDSRTTSSLSAVIAFCKYGIALESLNSASALPALIRTLFRILQVPKNSRQKFL
jgi:hypothetical protein